MAGALPTRRRGRLGFRVIVAIAFRLSNKAVCSGRCVRAARVWLKETRTATSKPAFAEQRRPTSAATNLTALTKIASDNRRRPIARIGNRTSAGWGRRGRLTSAGLTLEPARSALHCDRRSESLNGQLDEAMQLHPSGLRSNLGDLVSLAGNLQAFRHLCSVYSMSATCQAN
jgi:hypothetical protein